MEVTKAPISRALKRLLTRHDIRLHDDSPERRHEFIALLFALAVGELGVQASNLVRSGGPIAFLPAYVHLFLATIMIAASWVGWSTARAKGALSDVTITFERQFLVLLVDVLIVIEYFIIVRAIDLSGPDKSDHPPFKLEPSTSVTAWGVFAVFATYVLWDICAKQDPRCALTCAACSFINVLFMGGFKCVGFADAFRSPFAASFSKLSLVGLVLLFRALQLRWPPADDRSIGHLDDLLQRVHASDEDTKTVRSAILAKEATASEFKRIGAIWTVFSAAIWVVSFIIGAVCARVRV